MPTITRSARPPSRRDSWPPTQLPLYRSIEADDVDSPMDVDHDTLIEDDPMNSFLTPIPLLDDGDTDDEDVMDMDLEMGLTLDAGIEDPHRPGPTIRSISPSKLHGGLRPPPPRTPTPPHLRSGSRSPPSRNSPEVSTPSTEVSFLHRNKDGGDDHDDDDGEDYVRFPPGRVSPPFGLHVPSFNLGSSKARGGKARRASKAAAVAAARSEEKEQDRVALMMARGDPLGEHEGPLAPSPALDVNRTPTVAAAARGRGPTSLRPRLPDRPRSWSGASGYASGRLSPRAWREPSPDVWSIEEDVEGEVWSEMEVDVAVHKSKSGKSSGKRVRFALPVREEIP